MGGDGEEQATRTQRVCDVWADTARDGQPEEHETPQPDQDWKEIVLTLQKIKDDLTKEEDNIPRRRIAIDVERAIRRVKALETRLVTSTGIKRTQLDRIEAGIKELRKETRQGGPHAGGPTQTQDRTWATVAAQAARTANAVAAPQRAMVRIRIEESQGKAPKELLEEIQKTIPAAYAVRTLKSGDVDVHVTSQAVKDQIINGPDTTGFKILRKDYLLEIPGVPLTTLVESGRNADNSELINSICEATKRLAPGVAISRIRWLHNPEELAKRQHNTGGTQKPPVKTRGTLIVGVPTQAIQQRVIKSGMVIHSQLFEVRLFDNSLIVKQCFRCNQWGHSQSACGKQVKCAQCAGAHSTIECPKERVSCVNCGRNHKAWQRKECKTFQSYLDGIRAKRMALLAQTLHLRGEGEMLARQPAPPGEFQIVTRKRGRQPTPPGNVKRSILKRGPGRPSFVETASRDASQTTLGLRASSTQRVTVESDSESDLDMEDPISTSHE